VNLSERIMHDMLQMQQLKKAFLKPCPSVSAVAASKARHA